jgi:hypothetical protein
LTFVLVVRLNVDVPIVVVLSPELKILNCQEFGLTIGFDCEPQDLALVATPLYFS